MYINISRDVTITVLQLLEVLFYCSANIKYYSRALEMSACWWRLACDCCHHVVVGGHQRTLGWRHQMEHTRRALCTISPTLPFSSLHTHR